MERKLLFSVNSLSSAILEKNLKEEIPDLKIFKLTGKHGTEPNP